MFPVIGEAVSVSTQIQFRVVHKYTHTFEAALVCLVSMYVGIGLAST